MFKTTYKAKGLLATVADFMNSVNKWRNGINIQGGRIESNGSSIDIIIDQYCPEPPEAQPDYSFKCNAVRDDALNTYTVTVLGGTAQVFGGSPFVYPDTTFYNAVDGDNVFVVFNMCTTSFLEIGTWAPTIKIGSSDAMSDYAAPYQLVYHIATVGYAYTDCIRQGHEGNILMPAISNVVDVQTKLP